MELNNKNVLVVGSGISGVAATILLGTHEANVTLLDSNEKLDKESITKQFPEGVTADIILGELSIDQMKSFDLIVVSPGVPTDLPFLTQMTMMRIPMIGEIELAYLFEKGRVVAITGTNGKTTTTALTGQIMKTHFEKVCVVGNIGMPYTTKVLENDEESVTVAEVSSFQLETVKTFRPKVSAILNITPDHLNRHHTMEKYIEAKCNVTMNQQDDDTCVLNYEDEVLREFGKTLSCKVVFFSSKQELERGLYLRGEDIVYNDGTDVKIICNIHELKILGAHNYENVMAAVAMAMAMEVPMDSIHKAITEFVAVEHRIEYVAEIDGVRYYNDSKGTNTDAAIKAIQAMNRPTHLIGGGYDKNSEFDEWIQSFNGKVKTLVLLGQTREKIEKTARANGFNNIVLVDSLEEAVNTCVSRAVDGDAVLLSPACASWGMFKNYEERGEQFKELVLGLENK